MEADGAESGMVELAELEDEPGLTNSAPFDASINADNLADDSFAENVPDPSDLEALAQMEKDDAVDAFYDGHSRGCLFGSSLGRRWRCHDLG